MALPKKIKSLFKQNANILTTAQANAAGISNERLRLLVKSGDVERATFGVYVLAGEYIDTLYIAQLRRPKIIYSHETALFLHGLVDRYPSSYTVTVPTGYNIAKLKKDSFTVYSIKRELHKIGTTKTKTMYGNTIILYDLERTICDCLRSRKRLGDDLVNDVIKRYAKRKDKKLSSLMSMAKTFRVTSALKNYLEVLLMDSQLN